EAGGGRGGGSWGVERGGGGGAGVSGEGLSSLPGYGGDDAGGGVDTADAVIRGVGEVDVAGGVDREAEWKAEGGCFGRGVVAVVACGSYAGDSGDDTRGGGDLTDAMVVGVGE